MWFFYSSLKAALSLKRTCRKCRHTQVAKPHLRNKKVVCNRCGADILPPNPYDQV